ncbi:MAG TPA: matrixin family metalloprotease [Gammaproteobacteria bacterium]|nr:matrixin family metalloprotease [Gammaproteobacteria bacterium]
MAGAKQKVSAARLLIVLSRFLAAAALALGAGTAGAQNLERLEPSAAHPTIGYYIAPGEAGSQFRPGDVDLARWALGAWQRALGGALELTPAPESEALLRVHFIAADAADAGQYGEMRAIRVDGQRGAEVFIRPDTDALGPEIASRARVDALFRDTIVYLTCLHELGHALGLRHTASFDDVMYFFGFGGDIPEFFGRYRRALESRNDIAKVSGLSAGDLAHLHDLYRRK